MAKGIPASRRGGELPDDGYGDRISSLPEPIICHILSFLPTKFAAATSILSTRWRYLYLDLHSFDFDDQVPNKGAYNHNFVVFVNNILLQSKVSKFRLRSLSPIRSSLLNSWISSMLSRHVKVLDLWIPPNGYSQNLPSQIFTSKALVVLKLYGQAIRLTEGSFMPNLKVLHLQAVHALGGNNGVWDLSAECYPLLEDLQINNAQISDEIGHVKIMLHSLTKLAFINSKILARNCVFTFQTPNLRYFECDRFRITYRVDETVPEFAQHLTKFKINSFGGSEAEFEAVRSVLQHSPVLELVSLQASEYGFAKGWPFWVCQKLMKFSRCSKKCELVVN